MKDLLMACVHLAHFGNPVLGDTLYGNRTQSGFSRLALHAYQIEFTHPFTLNRLRICCPLPVDLGRFMADNFLATTK